MIANFDLSQLLTFPIKDDAARKNFLIASLVYLAGFIIPIVPIIAVMGYAARIMRQIINGEAPHMPAWDDWESMFKDGLYLLGIRIVYMLPLFIILFPLMFGMIFVPILAESNHVIAKNDFAAGFRVREWWAIFRVNWKGFLLASLIAMFVGMVLSAIIGVAMATIVLICLLPFVLLAISAYLTIIMYAAYAHAYKGGKDRLALGPSPLPASQPQIPNNQ